MEGNVSVLLQADWSALTPTLHLQPWDQGEGVRDLSHQEEEQMGQQGRERLEQLSLLPGVQGV